MIYPFFVQKKCIISLQQNFHGFIDQKEASESFYQISKNNSKIVKLIKSKKQRTKKTKECIGKDKGTLPFNWLEFFLYLGECLQAPEVKYKI